MGFPVALACHVIKLFVCTYAHMEERWVQVGGFCIMMKEDMKRVAPLWLNFSKKVRHDPDVSYCASCSVRWPP